MAQPAKPLHPRSEGGWFELGVPVQVALQVCHRERGGGRQRERVSSWGSMKHRYYYSYSNQVCEFAGAVIPTECEEASPLGRTPSRLTAR